LHRNADDGRLSGPGLGQERRIRLTRREEGQTQILARRQQGRYEPADVGLPAAGLAGNEVKDVEADVQGYRR
jgi:hypothetical protein